MEGKSESFPAVLCHDISTVRSRLQTAYDTVFRVAEVLQDAAQLGAEPQGTCLSVNVFEDKNAAGSFSMETSLFDDTN